MVFVSAWDERQVGGKRERGEEEEEEEEKLVGFVGGKAVVMARYGLDYLHGSGNAVRELVLFFISRGATFFHKERKYLRRFYIPLNRCQSSFLRPAGGNRKKESTGDRAAECRPMRHGQFKLKFSKRVSATSRAVFSAPSSAASSPQRLRRTRIRPESCFCSWS